MTAPAVVPSEKEKERAAMLVSWAFDSMYDANGRRLRDDVALALAAARAAGREEALEEAAKIAYGHFIYGHSVAGPEFAAACGDKIRALRAPRAEEGEGK